MGKKKKDGDAIGLLIFLGALWLLAQIFSKKEVTYYRCPHCRGLIQRHVNPCPFCGNYIAWQNPYPIEGIPPIMASSSFWALRIVFVVIIASIIMLAYCTIWDKEASIWSHFLTMGLGYAGGHLQATVSPR